MALSGWGLTPGTLEKNVTRSLGGKHGAVGNSPTTVSGMMRDKYSAGLQAKSAKEQFDFAKTSEENRKAESARNFGLESEKFGFTQSEADKKWADAQRQYELDKSQMEGGWSQQALDRALREQQLLSQEKSGAAELAQRGQISAAELAQRSREAQMTMNSNTASLAERTRAAKEMEALRREQEARAAEAQAWNQQQDELDRKSSDQTRILSGYGGSSGARSVGGGGYSGGIDRIPSSVQDARAKDLWYEAMGLPKNAMNEYNNWQKSLTQKISAYNQQNQNALAGNRY